jgi:hypothetical protein
MAAQQSDVSWDLGSIVLGIVYGSQISGNSWILKADAAISNVWIDADH